MTDTLIGDAFFAQAMEQDCDKDAATDALPSISEYSIFEVMEVDFDFEDATEADKAEALEQTIGKTFTAKDYKDLVENITEMTGWCVFDIGYRKIA